MISDDTKHLMIQEAIIQLSHRENLSFEQAQEVMNEIMRGEASAVQMSAYLTALALKGESIEEITASAKSMRAHCVKLLHNMDVLEIVGTGGDGSNSFNISTTAAIVVSSAGVSVAKHGNRAASSKSGAADMLEALGVNIALSPEQSQALLQKINICFLFAQNYHISMKYVAPIRKELGIKTIFNILGPLCNPAGANMELMGVYDESLVEPLAKVMCNLGVKRGMVVYGKDRLDEISMSAPTKVCEIDNGKFSMYEINPNDVGYEYCAKDALKGGDARENAQIAREILYGEQRGAKREAVCFNAGAALYIAKKALNIQEGVRMAENLIDEGTASRQLERFITESNR
ncbi:anthranilate phosphoribosyltransferase [uncultured Helicobacter sp.]|uniref:anthranilate phosphoribosyltransferase n=1 Tax=uncultured Helicobacter sp. TaxID=175537 RepID=UPI001C3B4FB7|nr:anthranilate phosphoribosyltransferase [Candidatus Helicobacter avicola]